MDAKGGLSVLVFQHDTTVLLSESEVHLDGVDFLLRIDTSDGGVDGLDKGIAVWMHQGL